jgi:UDP-3-O-[3-hydroxymyristoyl] glucosamine N-acyltransferase
MNLSLQSLATSLVLNFEGDPKSIIRGVGSLSNASADDLCFIKNGTYIEQLANSDCSTAIVPLNFDSPKIDKQFLYSSNPHFSFIQAIDLLVPQLTDLTLTSIHASAQISDSAKLGAGVAIGALAVIGDHVVVGEGTSIGAGCIIERNVTIGSHCLLHSGVTLCREVVIGNNCILQSGVVLGGDGFGLVMHEDRWHKVQQIGTVILEDDVEIGANTTVDRGALDNTVIEQGCKLDNLIQVGHNVRIGAHTAIAANAGIAGSVTIGRYCQISGCVTIVGHLNIVDHVIVTAMSLVSRSIKEPGVYSSGTPLQKNKDWHRSNARYKALDKLAKSVALLEKNSD